MIIKAHPIISLQEARAAGLTQFFSGVPCKHGHVANRLVYDQRCVECTRIRKAAYFQRNKDRMRTKNKEWTALNPDKVYGYTNKWRKANKEQYETKLEAWRKANPDKNRAYAAKSREKPERRIRAREKSKQWYKENKERALTTAREWARKNPHRVRVYKHKRRTLLRAAEGFFTAQDLAAIKERQRHRCAVCKAKLPSNGRVIHLDHIVALTKGGTNWPRNLQFLCISCNSRKNNRDPIDFMRSIGFLL